MLKFLKQNKTVSILIMTVLNAGVISNLTGFHYNFFSSKFDLKLMFFDILIYFIAAIIALFMYQKMIDVKGKSGEEKKEKDNSTSE